MKTKLRVTPLSEQLKKGTLFVGLGGLFVIVVQLMDLDVEIFVQRFGNLPEVLMRFAAFDITLIPSILSQTLLSICLAFSALVLGASNRLFSGDPGCGESDAFSDFINVD